MSGFLIDTNVLSELTRPQPAAQVEAFLRKSKDSVFASVLSIGEIRKGLAALPDSKRRASLEQWLELELRPWFAGRIIPVSLEVAECWGEVSARMNARGRPRPVVDSLIAATAIHHKLVLVTRNVRDFEDMQLELLNPWE